MFNIPTRLLVGRVDLFVLKKDLTAIYVDQETKVETPVPLYRMVSDNVIAIPRSYGRRKFPDIWRRAVNKTTRVEPGVMDLPIRIRPRDPDQQAFLDGLVNLFESSDGYIDAQANAATGSGKTASACMMQAQVGVGPMLVIVHTNRLKEGWLGNEEATKGLRFFYGDQWVADNVGIVQQDVCDYKGKAIVIAMAPSLCSRRYPDEFYKAFPLVVVDELHKMATPVLNRVLGMFSASARVTLTATPKEGRMAKVPIAHVGRPVVVSKQEVLHPKVCRLLNERRFDFRDDNGDPIDNRNSLITFMARDHRRQGMLADIVFYRGFQRGRHCLVLSDRTDQLLDLRRRLVDIGVPYHDIGMYVGAHKTGAIKLTGSIRTGDNVIHFRGIPGFAKKKDAERYVRDKTRSLARSAGVRDADVEIAAKYAPELHKPTSGDYERIEHDCHVVLATYGVFDTGIDIKRLDWGLEATPRSDVAQAVGRVLRLMAGKPLPEWYTVYDKLWTINERMILGKMQTNRYEHKTPSRLEKARRKSYAKQNATLVRIDNPYEAIEKAKAA